MTFEVLCGVEFLSIGSPYYIIYPGRFSAPVGGHSPHRQQSGGTRMCQQPLQGQSRALSAEFDCLGNTYLQPSHLLPDGHPIDGVPVLGLGERRINSERSCHLLFFLHDGSACSLARRDQTDVGVSGALRAGIGFFGPLNAVALDPPCGEVCRARTRRAGSVSMFHNNPSGRFRFALYTGSAAFALGERREPNLTACLLAQACQSLWLGDFDGACERSFCFNRVILF